jgi:hypothetical protein
MTPGALDHGTIHGLLERGRREDAQIPPINQLRAHEEDAVEDQHDAGRAQHDRPHQPAAPPRTEGRAHAEGGRTQIEAGLHGGFADLHRVVTERPERCTSRASMIARPASPPVRARNEQQRAAAIPVRRSEQQDPAVQSPRADAAALRAAGADLILGPNGTNLIAESLTHR